MTRLRQFGVFMALLAVTPALADSIALSGPIRDFNAAPGGHPDFEITPPGGFGVYTGAVQNRLDGGGQPVLNSSAVGNGPYTSVSAFDQWWRAVPGVNQTGQHTLVLSDSGQPGLYTYSSNSFFPIDNQLLGNEGRAHNYHFTYRIHTTFTFDVGDTLTFRGDDDVWVFLNGRLAIDLGGIHAAAEQTVTLSSWTAWNSYRMRAGRTYSFDLFFAERHTTLSEFTLTTNMQMNPTPEPAQIVLFATIAAVLTVPAVWRRFRCAGHARPVPSSAVGARPASPAALATTAAGPRAGASRQSWRRDT